jgi:3',5'-cyclic AMP phosphodiesterase CpdA
VLILHISDIHFRKTEVATAQDPNFHLRNELVRDVVVQCQKLGPPDAIIVSGDIAFAGDPAEFAFATDWLKDLCQACGATLQSVFVCPGNHDVVREHADRYMVQLIHNAIKKADDPVREISKQMRDPDARRLLYEGLDNYNAFALQFFCDLLPPERTRATRDLLLNDGSTLRLWGLNTAFVSSSVDKERDLFVDQASCQIPRSAGVVNLVVAHHHLSWLRRPQILEDHLNDVAQIQIFGHVHTNRIVREVAFLRLTASAANPERSESNWEPGYNLLEISVEGDGDPRLLKLRAHVRIWQAAPGGFQPKRFKDEEVWEHSIKLEAWSAPVGGPAALEECVQLIDETTLKGGAMGTMPKEGSAMNKLRDVGLRFYRLSFSKKFEIAGRLGLLEEEDKMQPDFERFRRVFQRANQREKLDELATAVQDAENGQGGK